MRIFFYPECNFNINKASVYDCGSLAEWFDSQHKNPDDYEIVGKDGEYHDSDYNGEVCAVYPKIMGGKKKGKNILTAVVGLALVLASGGALGALSGALHMTGTMVHTLGAGLLLSGGGALLMGKMKMPSMDIGSESATKQSYQWNVGNLSTSRGVKGVTFGSNVIPEGELLAYKTYGTNSIQKIVERIYSNQYRNATKAEYDAADPSHRLAYFNYKKGVDYTYKVQKYTNSIKYSNEDDSSYLEVLIGAGEGELDSITDIKINDIALSDLDMVENTDYAVRLGSNTQTALKQTNLDSQVGYSSIGQTVPQKLNDSVTPLLVTTPEACDSCEIAFQTNGWYLYDTSSGAKNNAYIKLRIGYRVSGSSGDYTYLAKTISEIDNKYPIKSESAFYFKVAIKFPSNGTYQICIENDSAELNYTKGLLTNAEYAGSALPDRAALNLSCDNIACYVNKEQTYPNTALIWLRIPASQTLNGSMPKITWKQTRANIYAYNGSSYITKPADNLAWAIYDIIAQVRKDGNAYHNEGEDVSNINYDKFVAFAAFCDSIGAKGNWFLNKLDTSWSNAMSVATSCRAFIGLRSGKVCPYWDAPTEMTQIFTVGNYEDMSGVITAKKDRAKAIEATFNNEEEKYASRTVRVEIDNDHSAEAVSMTFVGLSNPVNVSKQAHYILRRNKYLVQSIKFTADIDSIVCELNDVIGIQCDLTEYGVGGRIFKVENNVISLDAPVTLTSGNSYALLVRHTDGTLERKTPVETNGTYTQLTFNSAWSKPVLKGDVYSFGIANSEVRKYRVTGITRTNDLKAQIEAIEYNENVYDELAVAPYTYTNPNAGINNVTTTYTPEAVELAWDANNNTSYVNVYVDGVFYGRYQNGATIPNINSEQLVEMFPVNEYGEEDTPVVRTISNNLPTPSTPPVPVVQSTTTGVVAEFSGIPKDENIVWLIIKEGDNELGRANILGEYMSVSIQLRSGTHTLSAYFVNQFSKSSQARTFTATPLGDIQANDISASALKLPTGSILRLSAKNCTTASIAEANGVKDVSGNGNHGRAYGGVTVLDGGEGYSFDGTDDYILNSASSLLSKLNSCNGLTITFRAKCNNLAKEERIGGLLATARFAGFAFKNVENQIGFGDRSKYDDDILYIYYNMGSELLNLHTYSFSVDYTNGIAIIFVDGEEKARDENWFVAESKQDVTAFWLGCTNNVRYCDCSITDVRVYPRALTASEIKTIYMFPDDVTFGQMTADLIGANIIKGTNLYSENIITQAAQINQAVFQSLIVTNGSTVANQVSVGGRNLLRNTSDSEVSFTSAIKNYALSSYAKPTVGVSDTLTISFEAKASASRWIDFCWVDTESITYANDSYFFPAVQLTTSYKKFVLTDSAGIALSTIQYLRCRQNATKHGAAETGATIYIKNLKLEIGNKATTWTPAPEDVDSDINTVQSNLDTVTTNIYSTNTTTINGGKITTGTIIADAIAANAVTSEKVAANAITADKINVTSALPQRLLQLNLKGCSASAGSEIPDLSSGHGSYVVGSGNNFNSISYSTRGWFAVSSSSSGSNKRRIINKNGTTLTLRTSFAFGISYYKTTATGASVQPILFEASDGTNNNKITIYITTDRYVAVDNYNSSGTKTTIKLGLVGSTEDMIIVSCSEGTWTSYVASYTDNDVKVTKVTSSTTSARTALTATQISFGNTYTGDNSRGSSAHRFSGANIFNSAISESQANYCLKFNALNSDESGQITADRLAVDAIKSRNYAYTSGLYSTAGTFLDLANGQIISKNFSIDSSGNATFKGALSGATGTFGNVTITQGLLNNINIANLVAIKEVPSWGLTIYGEYTSSSNYWAIGAFHHLIKYSDGTQHEILTAAKYDINTGYVTGVVKVTTQGTYKTETILGITGIKASITVTGIPMRATPNMTSDFPRLQPLVPAYPQTANSFYVYVPANCLALIDIWAKIN